MWHLPLPVMVCCLYKEVYLQNFKCVSFWLHGCCGEWEGGPVNQVNHSSWVDGVTPTDRPKSVRNRCLIELFCGVVSVVTLPFWHFCWCRGFCHRTGSDLFVLKNYSNDINFFIHVVCSFIYSAFNNKISGTFHLNNSLIISVVTNVKQRHVTYFTLLRFQIIITCT